MPDKKTLLIALCNKAVADIPDSEAIPGIRQADIDVGQIDIEGARPPVDFAWLGVDINITWEQLQMKQQRGKFTLTCRLAYDPFSSSASQMPDDMKRMALAYFDIEDKFYKAFQGWKWEYEAGKYFLMTGLRRTSETTNHGVILCGFGS